MWGDLIEDFGRGVQFLGCLVILLLPFAIWKVVELGMWVYQHLSISWN